MALNVSRANTILQKLDLPTLREATHFEARINEYGEKLRWVVDRDEWQALKAYPTVHAALREHLRNHWEEVDPSRLTPKEWQEVQAIL